MNELHYFKAEWCGPCTQTTPMAKESGAEIHDVDEEQDLANEYEVRSIPAVVVEEDGQVVDRAVGTSAVIETLEETA